MGLQKATIVKLDTGESFPVQFNPEEYTLGGENSYAQAVVPGRSSPLIQFSHGQLRTIEMELFFDTYEKKADVREQTSRVVNLLDIDPTTHAPPVLLFVWGKPAQAGARAKSFKCVLARATQRFVMFLPSGRPVRARVQVQLQEFTNGDFESKEVKRQTADYSKVRMVAEGETLSSIAADVYDDPSAWRALAIRNGIDDPFSPPVGRELAVPRLPYADPETGEVVA